MFRPGAARSIVASSGASYHADAVSLFARMTVQPDRTRKRLISNLITSLDLAGVWSKLDILYLLAAHDAQAARLNCKAAAFDATLVATPTFTVDRGYASDGSTSYMIAPTYNFVGKQDSCHMGLVSRTNIQANSDCGNANSAIAFRTATDVSQYRLNVAASLSTPATTTTSIGSMIISRTASNLTTVYKNGVSYDTGNAVSVAPNTGEMYFCGRRNGSSLMSAREYSVQHFGSALSGADVTALYQALGVYLAAVGA